MEGSGGHRLLVKNLRLRVQVIDMPSTREASRSSVPINPVCPSPLREHVGPHTATSYPPLYPAVNDAPWPWGRSALSETSAESSARESRSSMSMEPPTQGWLKKSSAGVGMGALPHGQPSLENVPLGSNLIQGQWTQAQTQSIHSQPVSPATPAISVRGFLGNLLGSRK